MNCCIASIDENDDGMGGDEWMDGWWKKACRRSMDGAMATLAHSLFQHGKLDECGRGWWLNMLNMIFAVDWLSI